MSRQRNETIEVQWSRIPEFPNYEISSLGEVFNRKRNLLMSTSLTGFGHTKITLTTWNGERHTRSVAQLVAEAFVRPPNLLCDQVVVLDGNFSNVAANNLVWRPRWFAWKYTRQLKEPQPLHFQNLPVMNVITGDEYASIIEAGMTEGLLFKDIWKSTYTGEAIYPDGSIFEVIK